jgi:hypothetical protein
MSFESELRTRSRAIEQSSGLCNDLLLLNLEYQPSTWVRLLKRPSPFSFEEGLLLCQCSEHEWLTWVPDYGEVTVDICDMRPLA